MFPIASTYLALTGSERATQLRSIGPMIVPPVKTDSRARWAYFAPRAEQSALGVSPRSSWRFLTIFEGMLYFDENAR